MNGTEAELRAYKRALDTKREMDDVRLKDAFKLLDGNKKAMMAMILEAVGAEDAGIPISFVVVFAKPGFLDGRKVKDNPTAMPETIIFEMSSGTVSKYAETELKDTLVAALEKWVERTYDPDSNEFTVIGKL
jgi:hypothetical protein